MFSDNEFAALYRMLNVAMVDLDCGIQCGKFCCVGNGQTENAFKYLLPGEAEFLVGHGFHKHAILEDFGFLIHYRAERLDQCVCEKIRNYRPICCRMFPFRPVIDVERGVVVDLMKVQSARFSPCWLESPRQPWREQAIAAWNFLFSDRDNLQFYARYYLCLKKSETSSASFQQALNEDEQFRAEINALEKVAIKQLWHYCREFFSYIS
jgi:hypothetical protein